MESEDDIAPLIDDVSERNFDPFLGLNAQVIKDPDFEQVIIIYFSF